MAKTCGTDWGLEVVRGREIGRVFPLAAGANVLGNALNGGPGIDLGAQEPASPRRMAARQATIHRAADGLTLSDLESPGGTFVNRQRLLPGQARRLAPGDEIQVGAVQLRVVEAARETAQKPLVAHSAPPPPSSVQTTVRPGSLATPFVTLTSGATCRTWDDFLTLSAKNWVELREELQSGRLSAYLKTSGRDDLLPPTSATKSPDERLDEWLGRLPTTRAVEPDLEVHPAVVRIRAPAGGGIVRAKVMITNTGFRLLRSSLRLEPAKTDWVRLSPTWANSAFTTAETTEVPFEVEVPETLATPRSAVLVIESNGGTRRVEVRVELPAKPDLPPEIGPNLDRQDGTPLHGELARHGLIARIFGAYLALLGVRALVIAGDLLARGVNLDGGTSPSLAGAAIVMAGAGGIVGGTMARRGGEIGDVMPGAFAGGFAGILLASLVVASVRAIEPALFGMRSLEVVVLLVIGTLAGWLSLRLVPYQSPEGEMT